MKNKEKVKIISKTIHGKSQLLIPIPKYMLEKMRISKEEGIELLIEDGKILIKKK